MSQDFELNQEQTLEKTLEKIKTEVDKEMERDPNGIADCISWVDEMTPLVLELVEKGIIADAFRVESTRTGFIHHWLELETCGDNRKTLILDASNQYSADLGNSWLTDKSELPHRSRFNLDERQGLIRTSLRYLDD